MSSYIPIPLLTDIVMKVGQSGFRLLGPFLAAGSTLCNIVFSNSVLSEVYLREFFQLRSMANTDSPYRSFFLRCVLAENHTAKYLESLRIAAQEGPSVQSLDLLAAAALHSIHARFAFGLFLCLCGSSKVGIRVLKTFLDRVPDFGEAILIAEQVCTYIRVMGTPGLHAYKGYKGMILLACGLDHNNGWDSCPLCLHVHYYFEIYDLC